ASASRLYNKRAPASPRRRMRHPRWLIHPVGAAAVAKPEVRKYGFARDRRLPLGDQRLPAFRQEYVQPRAEADQAETLTGTEGLALFDERPDAPRPQPCNLDPADATSGRGDHQRIALVILAGLVELGVDELSRPIGDALDTTCHGAAIHVAVEYAH